MAATGGTAIDLAAAIVTTPTAPADWLVIAPVVIPLFTGALLLTLRRWLGGQGAIALAGLALTIVCAALLLARVSAEGPIVMTMGRWLPPFGISFAADALGALLALTASIVGFIAALYSLRDIDIAGRRYGFYPFLMLMMAGVGGAFLTGDVFNLYVWFEVFVISSFGLLVVGDDESRIDGAVKYAILNLIATTLFLIATGYLYGVFGTLNMADLHRKVAAAGPEAPMMTLATLYLVAFGMKAAAFPVNFWLPASYHTPKIVTSALFGGLLTKIGIYALLRVMVMIMPAERLVLSPLIGWIAVVTMILGVLCALAQSDIRRMLGFVLISGIGVMLSGLALGDAAGLSGAILYAVHSMLVMTALYLLAGMIRDAGGSFSLEGLAGLYDRAPVLAAGTLLLAFAIAGLPPGSGLWPKVVLVKASIDAGAGWLAGAILVSGLLTTVAFGRVFLLAFWRKSAEDAALAERRRKVPRLAFAALVALLAPSLAMGLYPEPFVAAAKNAAAGLLEPSPYVDAVFPGRAP
jgi:multicomponent Na+:H+ antiporter subunit D